MGLDWMDTFIIDVEGTAEATWQGTVKAGILPGGQKAAFSSTLEMLKAIDNALETGTLAPDGNGKFHSDPE